MPAQVESKAALTRTRPRWRIIVQSAEPDDPFSLNAIVDGKFVLLLRDPALGGPYLGFQAESVEHAAEAISFWEHLLAVFELEARYGSALVTLPGHGHVSLAQLIDSVQADLRREVEEATN